MHWPNIAHIPPHIYVLGFDVGGFPLHIYVFAGVIATLVLTFLFLFFIPGVILRLKLGLLVHRLLAVRETDGDDLARFFKRDKTFAHLWSEFRETLHAEKQLNTATGQHEVVALRSTVAAEAFFNVPVIVETRLRTEFFKHLPGIFTGIGIIGTFYGLIIGLDAFHVSESPTIVRESLNGLLQGVWQAFLVSAIAITMAMVVTFFEKLLLSGLNKKVTQLAQLLDSFFEAGAGEEYLARLVRASEDSASQTKILKDALVADLKEILTDLSEKQIAAASTGNTQLAQHISENLQVGLKEPLERIASAVGQVSQDQGSAVNRLLSDVLSGFSQRLEELFGGQISGINQMQQQTVQALQAAVTRLEQMASNIEGAGQHATDAMTAKVSDAVSALEARQQAMNQQMAEFVEQIRALVRDSQSETGQKLQALLGDLGEKVSGMVGALKEQADRSAAAHIEREARVAEKTEQTVAQLGGQLETVLGEVAKSTAETRLSVEAMRGATSEALAKMNSAADTLAGAASDFAKAGHGVSGVLSQATNVSNQLTQAAGSVAAATRSLDGVLNDYKAARDMVAELIASLEEAVQGARREASVTADVLSRIEGASAKLAEAQQEADQYLQKVSEVLASSHQSFAESMKRTVSEANTQFYDALSNATKLLREGIQELEATLAAIPAGAR